MWAFYHSIIRVPDGFFKFSTKDHQSKKRIWNGKWDNSDKLIILTCPDGSRNLKIHY